MVDLLSERATGEVSDVPVIVMDEVNAMLDPGHDDSDLKAMLDFFINVRDFFFCQSFKGGHQSLKGGRGACACVGRAPRVVQNYPPPPRCSYVTS